jgi:hypothetical protein
MTGFADLAESDLDPIRADPDGYEPTRHLGRRGLAPPWKSR